ncbi:MAG: sigma 54-interacting transcriptional regulator [Ndongobacter sp.]|nr:sigma 54-interacting transcriptional regulator [Ndongobacter sp.]
MKRETKDFVQVMAQTIADTTMCHVTITDINQRRIAGTGAYFDRIGEKIPLESAFQEVYRIKKTIVIENPTQEAICRNCHGLITCAERFEICTPILQQDQLFGVIGIFAENEAQKIYIMQRREAFQSYAENMARLIASYLYSEQLLLKNKIQKSELDAIIENTGQAVICVDGRGKVQFLNSSAMELLQIRESREALIGAPMERLGTSMLLRRALHSKEVIRDAEDIVTTTRGGVVTISASVNRIYESGHLTSVVITARDSRVMQKAAARQRESKLDISFDSLLGHSRAMREVISKAKIAAAYDSTILITGESGTGKELFARAIHRDSPRSNGPFISINCSAIPETLLESELFGYEAGAFTGASEKGKIGKLELANHGTIFLDEIGDMPLFLQVKLLRVLQDRRIMKIGGTKYLDLNLRIISATNQDLEAMIERQEFREDLYYRLNVIPIELPSLRHRREDIPELVEYFLHYFSQRFGKNIRMVTSEALELLRNHEWKGNVRELENIVEYLVNFSLHDQIGEEEVYKRLGRKRRSKRSLEQRQREFEQQLFAELLQEYGSNTAAKRKISEELEISPATLYRKLAQLDSHK